MKKNNPRDLHDDYDFSSMSGGVQGKYAEKYRAGTNIAVLADDVAEAFPTDEAVNDALRSLIASTEDSPSGERGSK